MNPIIDEYGNKHWLKDGLYHRDDGPAIEDADGYKAWCINGLYHRLDGPAKEYNDGSKSWYYEGKYVSVHSQKEFERLDNLKLFW